LPACGAIDERDAGGDTGVALLPGADLGGNPGVSSSYSKNRCRDDQEEPEAKREIATVRPHPSGTSGARRLDSL
jgi:hypothetical protein